MQDTLFDVVKTNDNRTYIGVVDYVSPRHVTIFDLTNNKDPVLSMAVILYKLYYPTMRFSVFKAQYFAHYPINAPLMVNKRNIKESSVKLETHIPNKKVFKFTNKS